MYNSKPDEENQLFLLGFIHRVILTAQLQPHFSTLFPVAWINILSCSFMKHEL